MKYTPRFLTAARCREPFTESGTFKHRRCVYMSAKQWSKKNGYKCKSSTVDGVMSIRFTKIKEN